MDKRTRLLLIGYLLCVVSLCIPTAVGLMVGIIDWERHTKYIAYDVPQSDPFSHEQRVEYFTACGYVVVAEGREGHFIVKRVALPDDSTEDSTNEGE